MISFNSVPSLLPSLRRQPRPTEDECPTQVPQLLGAELAVGLLALSDFRWERITEGVCALGEVGSGYVTHSRCPSVLVSDLRLDHNRVNHIFVQVIDQLSSWGSSQVVYERVTPVFIHFDSHLSGVFLLNSDDVSFGVCCFFSMPDCFNSSQHSLEVLTPVRHEGQVKTDTEGRKERS